MELAPNESFFDVFTTPITLSDGWDKVNLRADHFNEIAESNEMNNNRVNTIAWPPAPDLTITKKYELWQVEGESYTVNYQVYNMGNAPAPAGHDVRLMVDGVLIETKEVPVGLGPGESFFDVFTTVIDLTGNQDKVNVRADHFNE